MDPNNQTPQYPQNPPEQPTTPPIESTPTQPYQPVPASFEQPTSSPTPPANPSQQPAFAAPTPNGVSVPAVEDPGKVLAIVGIVLAFFFTLLGLILSIVASKKSKAAGYDGSLAKIGIILNAIFLGLQVLATIGLVMMIVATASKGI